MFVTSGFLSSASPSSELYATVTNHKHKQLSKEVCSLNNQQMVEFLYCEDEKCLHFEIYRRNHLNNNDDG